MIRPSAEDIDAIVETARQWPEDARTRLIERLTTSDRLSSAEPPPGVGGPTAAEVVARFGQPGPGPSDETVRLWMRDRKEARGCP